MEYLKLLPSNIQEEVLERVSVDDYFNIEIVYTKGQVCDISTDTMFFIPKVDIYFEKQQKYPKNLKEIFPHQISTNRKFRYETNLRFNIVNNIIVLTELNPPYTNSLCFYNGKMYSHKGDIYKLKQEGIEKFFEFIKDNFWCSECKKLIKNVARIENDNIVINKDRMEIVDNKILCKQCNKIDIEK